MFSTDQTVNYKAGSGSKPARIVAQRHYTDAYRHWDIEVDYEHKLEDGSIKVSPIRHLGIPENVLEAV